MLGRSRCGGDGSCQKGESGVGLALATFHRNHGWVVEPLSIQRGGVQRNLPRDSENTSVGCYGLEIRSGSRKSNCGRATFNPEAGPPAFACDYLSPSFPVVTHTSLLRTPPRFLQTPRRVIRDPHLLEQIAPWSNKRWKCPHTDITICGVIPESVIRPLVGLAAFGRRYTLSHRSGDVIYSGEKSLQAGPRKDQVEKERVQ